MMTLYRYDKNGYFTESFEAQVNQVATRRKGETVFFEYKNATEKAPPSKDGYNPRIIDGEWILEKDSDTVDVESLKDYLKSTDYIDNKIIEASILGGASEIIAEYRPILLKRAETRKRINELENTEEV